MKKLIKIFSTFSLLLLLISCSSTSPRIEFTEQKGCPDNKVNAWAPRLYSYNGIEHYVYAATSNSKDKPPIILLHELPGLSKETLEYAQTLTPDFSVYVPLLFGEMFVEDVPNGVSAYFFNSEWLFTESRPIYAWARELSKDIAAQHPGKKMGVIGMCLTGAMPLALLDNKQITSIVVSQPYLPFIAWFDSTKASLDLSELEYCEAKQRIDSGEVQILGLRFQNDKMSEREKLKTLKTDFSKGYIDLEICTNEYADNDIPADAHSVLISTWNNNPNRDDPENILNKRRQQVQQFFKFRLRDEGSLPKGKRCTKIN